MIRRFLAWLSPWYWTGPTDWRNPDNWEAVPNMRPLPWRYSWRWTGQARERLAFGRLRLPWVTARLEREGLAAYRAQHETPRWLLRIFGLDRGGRVA